MSGIGTIVGRFDTVLNALRIMRHTFILQEISTGNWYRGTTLLSSLLKQPNEPGYNPGLRFAEVEYTDRVYQGTQGFISWIVPGGNPGQRLPLYRVSTVQNWNAAGPWWRPDLVNGARQ
jgi:hypothetical protein